MTRKNSIDIIKGMAIILMVYGHTFGVARDFIYLFHMPVFIFISGYCFNSAHADSLKSCEEYFFSRVRRLILPYMGFNIVFALLNNLFIKLNFYTDRLEFKLAVNPIQKAAQTLMEHRGLKGMFMDVYDVITLKDIPQMGSASWFLIVLFTVCVVHCFVTFFIGKLSNKYVRGILWACIFTCCLIIAYVISEGAVDTEDFAMRHLQFFEVYACYLMGVFAREYSHLLPTNRVAIGVLGIVAFFGLYSILYSFGPLEMSKGYIVHPMFLIVVTIHGMVLLASLAVDLENNKLGEALAFVGKHTLAILFLHILAFKLVSVVYCGINGIPAYMTASWPVLFDVPEWVKLCYTIVGVLVPLALDCGAKILNNSVKDMIRRK